jgi:hypothetical protein
MLITTEKLQAFRGEVPASDKRSSLLATVANYGQRGYGTIGRGEKKNFCLLPKTLKGHLRSSLWKKKKTFF